jgi:galactose oxidase
MAFGFETMARSWRSGLCLLALLLSAVSHAQSDPAQVGQWSEVKNWPFPAVHTHVLPTGKVMFFSEFGMGDDGPYLWNPETDTLQQLSPPGYNIFCAGHAFLPDGRLLIAGGHIDNDRGLPDAILFDPFTSSWSRLPDMADGRWYPTNTALANGEQLVVAGAREDKTNNLIPEIWSPSTRLWRRLTGASRALPYYPWMFLAPNGRVFVAGPRASTAWLNTSGSGAWSSGPRTRYGANRGYGSAVMYEPGKILIVGGDTPPTNSAEVINLNDASPAWRSVAPMRNIRRQHNATLLPDGKVLVTGGHSGSVLDDSTRPRRETELWDPSGESWTQLAPMGAYRGYHSVALLLPDGRILSAGGRGVRTMQVFSPPYLFKGARPIISSAPDVLSYGQGFTLSTAQAASIAQVTLVRLPSVTHAFDENQRFLRMNFQAGSGGLTVTAPANPNLAPPGHYMMFLVNQQGVPSVAKIVRIGGSAPPPPPPPPPTGQVAISFGAVWKYDDRNVDPGSQWMQPGYDDSAWRSGPAELGYGDGDERTVLRKTAPSQPSVYFRKELFVDGQVEAASLKVLFDDGFSVWVNGTPVLARNVSSTAHSAYASGTSGDDALAEAGIPNAPFVEGINTVAVMVKQADGSSSDVSFDLELTLRTSGGGGHPAAIQVEGPNGGELFRSGSTEQLQWLSHGTMSGRVTLEFSPDRGNSWSPIATNVSDTGSHAWVVPDVSTAQALVRVTDAEMPEVTDQSDAPFTLSRSSTYIAVPFGSYWRFDDRNVDPGPTWTSATFNDSPWREGPGELGYGDGDEHTVLVRILPNAQPSVYFRRKLVLNGAPTAARVRVLFDDGFALWVNGRQVASRNVSSTAHSAYATGGGENTLVQVDLDASAFVAGENTLAVMVKQGGPTSSDVSFDLELTLTGP